MRDVRISNDDIYNKYQKVMNEAKTGYRRKVQLLDDYIDNLMDDIEKRIQKEESNPTFQRRLFQMLADMTKEHGEFLLSIKRIASTIDSGSKTIPASKPFVAPNKAQGYDEEPPKEEPPQENVNEGLNIRKDQQVTLYLDNKEYSGQIRQVYPDGFHFRGPKRESIDIKFGA